MKTQFRGSFLCAVALGVAGLVQPVAAGCACDGNVDDSAAINAIDIAAILDCVRIDDCDLCVNSCDVNCDGDIDYRDAGAAWCQFIGLPGDCCARPNGACTPADQELYGTCIYTQEEFCESDPPIAGIYHGSNTVCSQGEPVQIPAASEWGLLALSLATLIGGTVVLRSGRRTFS